MEPDIIKVKNLNTSQTDPNGWLNTGEGHETPVVLFRMRTPSTLPTNSSVFLLSVFLFASAKPDLCTFVACSLMGICLTVTGSSNHQVERVVCRTRHEPVLSRTSPGRRCHRRVACV